MTYERLQYLHCRSVQVLGGWRTLTMVPRYSHLAPAHLRAAVERLVSGGAREPQAAMALRENFESAVPATAGVS